MKWTIVCKPESVDPYRLSFLLPLQESNIKPADFDLIQIQYLRLRILPRSGEMSQQVLKFSSSATRKIFLSQMKKQKMYFEIKFQYHISQISIQIWTIYTNIKPASSLNGPFEKREWWPIKSSIPLISFSLSYRSLKESSYIGAIASIKKGK